MAIRIDEYGHIIRDDSEQQPRNLPYTNTPSGVRPGRHAGLSGVFAVILIIVFLALVSKSCSYGNNSAGVSGKTLQEDISYNDQGETVQEPAKTLHTYCVPETQRESLIVDGILSGETISVNEEPNVLFSGSVDEENRKQAFSYTAPRDGRYRLDLIDLNANTTVRLLAWNAKGENIIDTYSVGAYAEFKANETVDIEVRYYSGNTNYKISIGVQKPTTDISSATVINDQISFSDQKNLYVFTAPIDGIYRFDLTNVNAGNTFRLMMWNLLGNNIMDTYSGGGDVTLTGGETYQIQVRHYSGLGSYKIVIGFQKPAVDISNHDLISDSIEYENQRNMYTFTAPIEGRYRFDLTNVNTNNVFRLMMWDRLDNNILDTYSGGGNVYLKTGETYRIQVRYNSGYGSYDMAIGYQKATEDLSDLDIVYDSITFADQINVYIYTPTISGRYKLRLDDFNSSCSLRLMAWDNLDNNIVDTYSGQGTAFFEAGKTYQIQVRHNNGCSNYSLEIEKSND